MIVAAGLFAVVLAGSDAQRDALLARWTHAAHAHVPAERRLRQPGAVVAPPVPLPPLAASELSVKDRYHLGIAPPPASVNPSWWQRLVRWLGERWLALWRLILGGTRLSTKATAVIGDAIVIAAAAALLFAVYQLAWAIGYTRRRATVAQPLAERPDAATLYARACARAASGDYAEATRLLFAAMLAVLDVRGTMPEDASATVGDVRRRLCERDGPSLASFEAVAAAFVAATYAELPIDANAWTRARDAYARLAPETA